ncbi:unnamed protein product [Onchocerca ochengi]|uniref:Helitron_like_N domain-containing protein n=1 Tax=Onchocerca ochengi TaxID=42157 RepID=A0A182DWW4_ONCOC|nr:unnamed protein product [Onchocerca ochengi]
MIRENEDDHILKYRIPRHMHEYTEDAIAYYSLLQASRPIHHIQMQFSSGRYTSIDRRHHSTCFQTEVKSLMDFMVKHEGFGSVRCWMCSVEWQKKGLPHILIWLYDEITSNEIGDVICAEIPDADINKDLYEVVAENMVHGLAVH